MKKEGDLASLVGKIKERYILFLFIALGMISFMFGNSLLIFEKNPLVGFFIGGILFTLALALVLKDKTFDKKEKFCYIASILTAVGMFLLFVPLAKLRFITPIILLLLISIGILFIITYTFEREYSKLFFQITVLYLMVITMIISALIFDILSILITRG